MDNSQIIEKIYKLQIAVKNKNSLFIAVLILLVSVLLMGGAVSKHMEMYFEGQEQYINRTGGAWDKAGRVVGVLKNPPQNLTIEFYKISKGEVVYTYKAPGKMFIYQSRFLPAGTYDVTFKAEGYANLTKKKLKIKKNADCLLNLKFSPRVFTNR